MAQLVFFFPLFHGCLHTGSKRLSLAASLTLLAPLPPHPAYALDSQYFLPSVMRPSPSPPRTLVLLDGPLLQQVDKLVHCVAALSGDVAANLLRTAVLELLDRATGKPCLSAPVVKRVAQLAAPLLVMNTAGAPRLSCTVIPVRLRKAQVSAWLRRGLRRAWCV